MNRNFSVVEESTLFNSMHGLCEVSFATIIYYLSSSTPEWTNSQFALTCATRACSPSGKIQAFFYSGKESLFLVWLQSVGSSSVQYNHRHLLLPWPWSELASTSKGFQALAAWTWNYCFCSSLRLSYEFPSIILQCILKPFGTVWQLLIHCSQSQMSFIC